MKKIILFAVAVTIWAIMAPSVLAHAVVYICAPHIGSTLAKPPAQIVCIFDGSLKQSEVTMTVTGPNGERVDRGDARSFEGDAYSYLVSLDTNKMTDGIYQVNWIVLDKSDNTRTSGTLQFGVNTVVPPTPTVLLPGQVIVTPSALPTSANANNGTSELISRFLIGAGVIVLAAMGVLFWRTRSGGHDAQE